jgi:ParB/RepB/Spo0J family partition protein
MSNTIKFGKAAKNRLNLSAVPRESGAVDRLLDNSRQVVRLDLIDDNPRNPRVEQDTDELRELAESIAEHGLLQAPVVRRSPADPDRYMVVMGARRVAAHRLLGRDEVEVIVRRFDDQQAFLVSCVENLQRVQLSPREEMDLIGVLADELGSGDAVARALGKSKAWVSKRRRIVGSPAFAAAVERGEIAVEHAYDVLAGAKSEEDAVAQLERVRGAGETRAQTRTAKRSGRAASNGAASAPAADALDTARASVDAPTTLSDIAVDAPTPVEPGDVDRLDELIDPRTLSIARLIRKGAKVPRAIVLEALHTDLQATE